MATPTAISIIEYKVIKDGTDAFLALIHADAFLNAMKSFAGFVSYTLVNLDEHTWCEYIYWDSTEAAYAGAKLSQTTAANMALLTYLDSSSFKVKFLALETFIEN